MWLAFLGWLKENQIGDLAGLAGLVISLVGFVATLIGVYRSRIAAERAEQAAWSAREGIRLFETVVDFSAAIAMLEDIKRGHRQEQWLSLLERYAAIRKVLVTLKAANTGLNAEQQIAIQSALTNVVAIERAVEASLRARFITPLAVVRRVAQRAYRSHLCLALPVAAMAHSQPQTASAEGFETGSE